MLQTTAQLQINDAYKRDLLAQIQARHEKQQAERQAYLEEGRKVRQEQAREKARLEQVSRGWGLKMPLGTTAWVGG